MICVFLRRSLTFVLSAICKPLLKEKKKKKSMSFLVPNVQDSKGKAGYAGRIVKVIK